MMVMAFGQYFESDGSGTVPAYKAGGSLKPASIETVNAKKHFIYQDDNRIQSGRVVWPM
jgi:hypothetical protein